MPCLRQFIFVLLLVPLGCDRGHAMRAPNADASPGADTDPAGMLPCRALKPLADLPVLGPWQAELSYYSLDRSWLLVQVAGVPDRLLRVELPSGNITTVVDGVIAVHPLANGGPFLIYGTGSGSDTSVYDGKEVRKLWSGQCKYQASEDGTRLYVMGACIGEGNGLAAVDVATGSTTIVDRRASMDTTWNIAVSPNGQWVAYTGDYDLDNGTIAVASLAGDSYTIASVRGAGRPQFVSDDLLVFHTGGKVNYHGDIRGHVPGSGDTSFVVASDLWPGLAYPYDGYQLSPDRTRVLAAKITAAPNTTVKGPLYSVSLRGGEPLLLVEDWALPRGYESVANPFYFDSQGNYVIYLSAREGDAQSSTTWVVDAQGSTPRNLTEAWASPTPATSSVWTQDVVAAGRYRLRLTDLATLRDRLSYSSNREVIQAATLRGDQAILFADYDGTTVRASFMSVSHPQPVLLGAWKEGSCRGCSVMPLYADPTGCFTIINTDVSSGLGTRLVLLPE